MLRNSSFKPQKHFSMPDRRRWGFVWNNAIILMPMWEWFTHPAEASARTWRDLHSNKNALLHDVAMFGIRSIATMEGPAVRFINDDSGTDLEAIRFHPGFAVPNDLRMDLGAVAATRGATIMMKFYMISGLGDDTADNLIQFADGDPTTAVFGLLYKRDNDELKLSETTSGTLTYAVPSPGFYGPELATVIGTIHNTRGKRLYVNGELVASDATPAGLDQEYPVCGIGGPATSDSSKLGTRGVIALACALDIALDQNKVNEWFLDPYGPFRKARHVTPWKGRLAEFGDLDMDPTTTFNIDINPVTEVSGIDFDQVVEATVEIIPVV